jgi:putative endonuclease
MAYYVYMLKCISEKIKKTYVGYTNNLTLRLKKHNSGKGAKSTRGLKCEIIYKKKFNLKSEAMSYEYKLKKNKLKRSILLQNSNE